MLICQVVGTVVATAKVEGFHGAKLLLVKERDLDGKLVGAAFVATDQIGAGAGEVVIVTRGTAARSVAEGPTDAAIVGLVDAIENDGKEENSRQWAISGPG